MTCIEIIKELEQNPPEIFVQCQSKLKTKDNPKQHVKSYVLNLTTGDIFKKRKLEKGEQPNFNFRYRPKSFINSRGRYDKETFASQQAHVVGDKLVLATWVFAPDTFSHIPTGYERVLNLGTQKMGDIKNPDAVANIVIPAPKIVAIIAISKDKSTETWEDLEHYSYYGSGKDFSVSTYLADSLRKAIVRPANYDLFNNPAKRIKNLFEAFKEFFGNGCVGLNRYYDFHTVADIYRFMESTVVYHGDGEMSDIVDALVQIPLPTHAISDEEGKPVCYADKVFDGWSVLRWWRKPADREYVECARMYANKSYIIPCVADARGCWICSNNAFDNMMFTAKTIHIENADVFDGTMFAYYKDVLPVVSDQGQAMYMCAIQPEFEKFCKSGLAWICNDFLDGYNRDMNGHKKTFREHVKSLVLSVNWDAKSPQQIIGINKHQLRAFNEFHAEVVKNGSLHGYRSKEIISVVKNIFCSNTLSGIDNDTFDAVLRSLDFKRLRTYSYVDAMHSFFFNYPENALEMMKNINAILGDEYKAEYNGEAHDGDSICRICADIIRMIKTGHREELIKPRFATLREIFDTHELLVEISNAEALDRQAKENEQYNEGFASHHTRWKKWEWKGDENFCVIAPKNPVDIAREGLTLKHCVKSYIPSIANGNTNVVFIRRKNASDKPFFTVEIDNRNHIRQVHGMCNANASTVTGLVEFVETWAKRKKLTYDNICANRMLMAG